MEDVEKQESVENTESTENENNLPKTDEPKEQESSNTLSAFEVEKIVEMKVNEMISKLKTADEPKDIPVSDESEFEEF